jgi:putative aminopeptidase FrvX
VEHQLTPLDPAATWVLNVDSVGSPRLIMIEGEGPVVMEDYCGPEFRDLIARAADRAGIELRRGMRARTSTDSVVPSHAGYPTATLASMTAWKGLSNYHKPSDTPENVDYATVESAARLAEAVVRELAP